MTTLELVPPEGVSVIPLAAPSAVVPIWPGAGGAFQSTGDASMSGSLYIGGAVATGSKASVPVDADLPNPVDGMLRLDTNANQLYFRSGGVWRQSGTPLATTDARYLQLAGGTVTGNLYVNGLTGLVGRLYTNNWDSGWANSLGGNTYVQSVLLVGGRFATGGWWDTGWHASFYGNVLINGYCYQRGSGSYRCWDNGDFAAPTVGVAGSTPVLRDGNGYIQNNYINLTADIAGGSPVYVAGQNGDNYLRWYPKAL